MSDPERDNEMREVTREVLRELVPRDAETGDRRVGGPGRQRHAQRTQRGWAPRS